MQGERKGFQQTQKLVQAYCQKKSKETATQLRKEIIIQKGVNIQEGLNKHLLSPGVSFNTFTYLKWRRESHTTFQLLHFFGSSSFSGEGHPCLSLRKEQTAQQEREGKQWKSYSEKEKKTSSEVVGRDRKERGVSEHSRAKSWVTPAEINGEPQAPAILCPEQLKRQQ